MSTIKVSEEDRTREIFKPPKTFISKKEEGMRRKSQGNTNDPLADNNVSKQKSIGEDSAVHRFSTTHHHSIESVSDDDMVENDYPGRRAQRTITQIGDAKQTIDDLKSSLLSYYSHLYTVSGLDIDSKLQQLSSQNIFPTSSKRESAIKDLYKYKEKPKVSVGTYLQDLPPPYSYENPLEQKFRSSSSTSSRNDKEDKYGKADNKKESFIPPLDGDETNFYGLLQKTEDDFSNSFQGGQNIFGKDLREMNTGGIYELLNDLQKKCMSASLRLATVGDDLCNEIEDPNLREWEYNTYPELRRRPCYGGREELRRHIITTFADLKSRSEINKRKIAALQSKIKILNMHTKSNMAKLKEDVRIGF